MIMTGNPRLAADVNSVQNVQCDLIELSAGIWATLAGFGCVKFVVSILTIY